MAVAAADLKALYQQRFWPNAVKVPLFYAIWIGLGFLSWKAPPLVAWVCYALMGYMQMGIVTFMHDCTHSAMFRTRWKNTAFGTFAMIPLLISYVSFREDHLQHHAFNRSPKDPDAAFFGKRRFADFVVFYVFCLTALPSLLQFGFLYCLQHMRGAKALQHWAEMAGHAILLCIGLRWASAHGVLAPALKVWLIPFLFFGWFNAARFIAEHYGTPFDVGQLRGTRTITTNAATRFFWNNINWHIGHHVYPAVPWYNLEKLHALMRPEIEALGAHVDRSYAEVFFKALLEGPESGDTVAKRNPAVRPEPAGLEPAAI